MVEKFEPDSFGTPREPLIHLVLRSQDSTTCLCGYMITFEIAIDVVVNHSAHIDLSLESKVGPGTLRHCQHWRHPRLASEVSVDFMRSVARTFPRIEFASYFSAR